MSEKKFSKEFREILGGKFTLYPFETEAPPAVPDYHGIIDEPNVPFWAELKYIYPDEKIKFQRGQRKWGKDYWEAGGNTMLIVKHHTGAIYLFNGRWAYYNFSDSCLFSPLGAYALCKDVVDLSDAMRRLVAEPRG